MKVNARDFHSQAARLAQQSRVFFLCGPDEASALDAATAIIAALPDAGECIDLSGADLRRDPVKLGDEARSTSLFGASRHIRVRASGDDVFEAVEILLDSDVPACPVIVLAPGATDKSKTAKLLLARPDAAVGIFYPPDLGSVSNAVRTMASAAGLRISGDLATRIARAVALDTRLAQAEVAKLALYLDASPVSPRTVEIETLNAITATTEDDGIAPLVNAVFAGDVARLPEELRKLREVGANPVGTILALERRAALLAQLAGRMDPRDDAIDTVKREAKALRIFWKDERDVANQLKRWRGPRLSRLLHRLMEMHRQLLANSQTAELLLAQNLAIITRAASGRS